MNTFENTERAILGAILFDHELLDQAAGLESSAFSLSSHQQIFLTMRRMARAGKAIDSVTLLDALSGQGIISSVGGATYLASLTEGITAAPQHRRVCRSAAQAMAKAPASENLRRLCSESGNRR
jgi:replicative DNA helicase